MKFFLLLAAALVVSGCLGVRPPQGPSPAPGATPGVGATPSSVRFQAADGTCQQAGECQELRYGCGKLICTSTPKEFENLITDCLVQTTPKDDGFACACVASEQRCGWVK